MAFALEKFQKGSDVPHGWEDRARQSETQTEGERHSQKTQIEQEGGRELQVCARARTHSDRERRLDLLGEAQLLCGDVVQEKVLVRRVVRGDRVLGLSATWIWRYWNTVTLGRPCARMESAAWDTAAAPQASPRPTLATPARHPD